MAENSIVDLYQPNNQDTAEGYRHREQNVQLRKAKKSQLQMERSVSTELAFESAHDDVTGNARVHSTMSASQESFLGASVGMRIQRVRRLAMKQEVQMLVRDLGEGNSAATQSRAAGALCRIAQAKHTELLVECDAVPALIALLSAPCGPEQYALSALGFIATREKRYTCYIYAHNVLPPLLRLLRHSTHEPVITRGLFCLAHFAQIEISELPDIYATLTYLLTTHDHHKILTGVFTTLEFYLKSARGHLHVCVGRGVCERLVAALRHDSLQVVRDALCVLRVLVARGDHGEVLLSCSLIEALDDLTRRDPEFHAPICEIVHSLSNVNVASGAHLARLFPFLVSVLRAGDHRGSMEAALGTIRNLLRRSATTRPPSSPHRPALVSLGLLGPLCRLLSCMDPGLLSAALHTLRLLMGGEERGDARDIGQDRGDVRERGEGGGNVGERGEGAGDLRESGEDGGIIGEASLDRGYLGGGQREEGLREDVGSLGDGKDGQRYLETHVAERHVLGSSHAHVVEQQGGLEHLARLRKHESEEIREIAREIIDNLLQQDEDSLETHSTANNNF